MISIFMMKEYALKSNARRRYHRDSTLSKAGIMLIMILLHDSDHPCLKHFHQEKMCEHMSAMLQALPYFVLKEIPLRLPLLTGVEYATAMTTQFPDVSELLSEHSLRQAVGKLAGTETQLLEKDSKKQMCRYIESDANQRILERLRNDIRKII